MRRYLIYAMLTAATSIVLVPAAPAQPDPKGQQSIHSELIGAPVYAADGVQIGEVADISFDAEDQPLRMRMTSGTALGLGHRTVELPARLFIVLRGAVVVDLPSDAVQVLPELAQPDDAR